MDQSKKSKLRKMVYIALVVVLWLPFLYQSCFRIQVLMFLVQGAMIYGAYMMFRSMFDEEESVFFGTIFYVTCPYWIYISYDVPNWKRMVSWMLLPFVIGGALKSIREKKAIWGVGIASVALAGMAYVDLAFGIVVCGVAVFAWIWYRKGQVFMILLIGGMLALPNIGKLFLFLLKDRNPWNVEITTISSRGYVVGHFFHAFVYPDDLPGLGLGLMGALAILWWLIVRGIYQTYRGKMYFVNVMAVCFLLMSLANFPWEMIQRMGNPFLRLVSFFETPSLFFGCACVCLSILGASIIPDVRRQHSDFVRVGFPCMLLISTLAVYWYLCNMG